MLFDAATFYDKENTVSFGKESKKLIHQKGYKFRKKWQGKLLATYWCTNCKSSKIKYCSKIKIDFYRKKNQGKRLT